MVVVFRGASGSGKSHLAKLLGSTDFKLGGLDPTMSPAVAFLKSLWGSIIKREHKFYSISADDFFMTDGEYQFDVKQLGAAHQSCLRNFTDVIRDEKAVIVVDNTNCSLAEFIPYAALANAFAHELHIITLITPPDVAWRRNTHNVPFANIAKQAFVLQDSVVNMPPWFPQQIFPE
jgi:predicted kinase